MALFVEAQQKQCTGLPGDILKTGKIKIFIRLSAAH
jgi:hypothetical protein